MTVEKQKNMQLSIAGVVAVLGCGVIVRGVSLWSRPGGWVLSGVLIVVPAVFVAYEAFREK